ncbi:asparagine synthase (glutamine-hydrolyzing) [Alienimonas californiensis]|uniref:asparagine synthase (glutamine-hydrolyzing) n=1 Tax=Alienimonas californiensis TaxID=2527989 RepID=A0A517PDB2_9PLAN|nr:asparagine synthase (glutamine-hydrolyzing) [Alienimonas californiensis]QDT17359.1 Asparagine synthetase [glutamine-hydrolyzing] 1 [Alienimonas californiensis]
MCGFVGAIWEAGATPVSEGELRAMTDALAHRGPDDADVWLGATPSGGGVALGHRRLSILDPTPCGRQPMVDPATGCRVAFNGEIYNYRELADRFADGRPYDTGTDTEVLLRAFSEVEYDCVGHFRGMFAFAAYDPRHGTLLLARDRLGQKPLFLRREPGRLLFASELKALLQVDGAPREVDPAAVDRFLALQYVPDPHCILTGYEKLPPGHRLIWRNGAVDSQAYWRPPYAGNACVDGPFHTPLSGVTAPEDWLEHTRQRVEEAVRLRLRSDVPLGAFLSGGVDSTVICAVAQKLLREAGAGPLKTFSIGFAEKRYDESDFARTAADTLGTDHHEFRVTPDAVAALPRLAWHFDEPFGDSSAIPTLALSEHTREHVTVALSGDGGDELFCGYERYDAVRLAARLDRLGPLKALVAAPLWQRLPAGVEQKGVMRRAKRFAAELAKSPQERYLRWIGIFDRETRDELYTPEFRARIDQDAAGDLRDAFAACGCDDGTVDGEVRAATCVDLLTYLPGDILVKVDRASMAVGLEARSPLLDHRVAELAAEMPQSVKVRGGRAKWPLKAAAWSDDFAKLPQGFLDRKKTGFGVPLGPWFRGELRPLLDRALLSDRALARGWFRPEAVRRLIEDHAAGRWDHSARLWCLLMLELWCRTWLDPATAPTAAPSTLDELL